MVIVLKDSFISLLKEASEKMVILYDDKIPDNTRYISFSGDEEKPNISLTESITEPFGVAT